MEPEIRVLGEVRLLEQRAADADVHGPAPQQEPLLGGPAEGGAVGHTGAEVRVPCVEVGVEVEHRDRAVPGVDGAEHGQRDRVVAAERDQAAPGAEQLARGGLDLLHRLRDRERIAGDVAGVDDLVPERLGVELRVVRAQQPRALPDRLGPEPRARPVRDAAVERDAEHGHREPVDLVDSGQARERRRAGEPRHAQRIQGTTDGRWLGHADHGTGCFGRGPGFRVRRGRRRTRPRVGAARRSATRP